MTEKRTVNVGIVGCGAVANMKHLPALARLDHVRLVGFCSAHTQSARAALEQYGAEGARVYQTAEALFADPKIEVVHICTPNSTHARLAIEALEAGKHVMCEKPMATSAADAEAMINAAKKNGKKLCVGLQNRYRKDTLALKKLCAAGELGHIYYARAQSTRRRGVPTWGVMTDRTQQGGGPLMDIGVHSLDLAMWLMDNYDVDYVAGNVFYEFRGRDGEANMFGPWNSEKLTVEDSAMGMVHMKNGACILVEASWALNIPRENDREIVMGGRESHVTLCGSKAGAELWYDGFNINGSRDRQLYIDPYKFDFDPQYEGAAKEAELWIDAVIHDTAPLVTPEQSLTLVRVIEGLYQSSEKHTAIYF